MEQGYLGDIADFANGKTRPPQIPNGIVPIYGGNGILGYTNQQNSVGETLVIGRVGAYCGSLYFENRPIWVTDNALRAIPKKDFYSKYLYFLFRSLELNSLAEGSGHPLLTQKLLKSIEIIIPTDEEVLQFNKIVDPLFQKKFINRSQITTLEHLRDTLLPKLMSGAVRVRL